MLLLTLECDYKYVKGLQGISCRTLNVISYNSTIIELSLKCCNDIYAIQFPYRNEMKVLSYIPHGFITKLDVAYEKNLIRTVKYKGKKDHEWKPIAEKGNGDKTLPRFQTKKMSETETFFKIENLQTFKVYEFNIETNLSASCIMTVKIRGTILFFLLNYLDINNVAT